MVFIRAGTNRREKELYISRVDGSKVYMLTRQMMDKARELGGVLPQLKLVGAQVCDLGPKQHICSGPD